MFQVYKNHVVRRARLKAGCWPRAYTWTFPDYQPGRAVFQSQKPNTRDRLGNIGERFAVHSKLVNTNAGPAEVLVHSIGNQLCRRRIVQIFRKLKGIAAPPAQHHG